MHYSNIVIIEGSESLEDAVKAVIGSSSEENGGWWDWYQIGGRWTGFFDGYEPNEDPLLLKICDLCGGTGKRKDMKVANGCNGCQGKGKRTLWPTQWPIRKEDAIPLHALTQEHVEKAHAVVLATGRRFENEVYVPWDKENPFHEADLPPASWLREHAADYLVDSPELFAVIVDSHC